MMKTKLMILVISLVSSFGCDTEHPFVPDPSCRCEGAVAEGQLSLACGELQCVGGTVGYECVSANTAIGNAAACTGSADAGVRVDAGEDGWSEPDAGFPDSSTPGEDAGGPDSSCTEMTYYRDEDGDGFGSTETMQACTRPSGYAENDDDCVDSDRSVNPDAVEMCDAVDNDCDGTAAACTGLAGTYSGTFRIYTDERVGSTVVNSVECTGTATVVVDLSGTPAVSGTAECDYSRRLGGFSSRQTSTITGTLLPDGTIAGSLSHDFGDFSNQRVSFTGMLSGRRVTMNGTGSWRPHPMSAVAWRIEMSVE